MGWFFVDFKCPALYPSPLRSFSIFSSNLADARAGVGSTCGRDYGLEGTLGSWGAWSSQVSRFKSSLRVIANFSREDTPKPLGICYQIISGKQVISAGQVPV